MTYDEWVRQYKSPKSTVSIEEWSRTVFEAGKSIEREACAKVCESFEDDMGYGKAQKCADAIRARGNK